MTYLIRPIAFEKEVPSIDVISIKIEENTSQEVNIEEDDELKGQYSIKLPLFPDDVLKFEIKEKKVIIFGDASDAPALNEILYTVLVLLGGTPSPNLSMLEFPISEKEIKDINTKVRRNTNLFGLVFWLLILVGIALICGFIYLLFSWL